MKKRWNRGLIFFLACALTGLSAWTGVQTVVYGLDNDLSPAMLLDDHAWVEQVLTEQHILGAYLAEMGYSLRSEENIKAGNTVTEEKLAERIYTEYWDGGNEWTGSADSGETLSKKQKTRLEKAMLAWLTSEQGYDYEQQDAQNEVQLCMDWLDANEAMYAQARQECINEDLARWQERNNAVKQYDKWYAYDASFVQDGDKIVFTNVENNEDYPITYELDAAEGMFSYSVRDVDAEVRNRADQRMLDYASTDNWLSAEYPVNEKDVIRVGLRPEALDYFMSGDWETIRRTAWMGIGLMLLLLLGAFLCVLWLIAATGHHEEDDGVRLYRVDRVWSEVYWAVGITVVSLCLVGAVEVAANIPFYQTSLVWMFCAIPAGLCALGAAVGLFCLLTQVRHLKTRTFLDGFVCIRAAKYVVERWKQGPLYMKVISAAIVIPLVCIPWITIPFVMAGLLYVGVRFAERLTAVLDGAKRIRAGETTAKIPVRGGRELRELAEDLNSISEGLHNAVETAVQSERLKSELISNVSHDLKTPLTGIITYVDLMKQLSPGDPKQQEYLTVVDQKTQRLSLLINDLLEASKASSGAMKTDLTRVDWEALFQQACGEMQEKLDAAGLTIRVSTNGRTDVMADGRKLWRIMDNLLSNCARYAMPNSRVYVELKEQGRWCVMTMKNISAQELNISADELMERFTRGDRARCTEGSGLGLSIARSLAELMHGTFHITVDGDLFKAEVFMPLWTGAGSDTEARTESGT